MSRKKGVFRPVIFIEFDSPEVIKDNKEFFKGRCNFDILINAAEKKNYSSNAIVKSERINQHIYEHFLEYPKYRYTDTGNWGERDLRGKAEIIEDIERAEILSVITNDSYKSFLFSYNEMYDVRKFLTSLSSINVEMYIRKDFIDRPNQEPIKTNHHHTMAICKQNIIEKDQIKR